MPRVRLVLLSLLLALGVFATPAWAVNYLYWAGGDGLRHISRADISGGASATRLDFTNSGGTYGIALDPSRGKLYALEDPGVGSQAELVSRDLATAGSRTVLSATGTDIEVNVSGLALDPVAGRVYWGGLNSVALTSSLNFARVDGSGGGKLYNALPEGTPRVLAIDPGSNRIYWIASSTSRYVYHRALDGSSATSSAIDLSTTCFGAGKAVPTAAANGSNLLLASLAVDPAANRVYIGWGPSTASPAETAFARVAPDGTGCEKISIGNPAADFPSGLAVDPVVGRGYWLGSFGTSNSGHAFSTASPFAGSTFSTNTGQLNEGGAPNVLAAPQASVAATVTPSSAFTGALLTCSVTWAGDVPGLWYFRSPASVTYAWTRNGTPIGGAASSTYTTSQAGSYGCSASGTNAAGATTSTSASSVTVADAVALSATQVGSGTVSSSPSGISLAAAGSASADFASGTSVTLTATPAAGWRFSGWRGDCTGGGTCTTVLSQARSVTATFVQVFSLSATQVGSGTVSSSPSGISLAAPGSTSADFDTGTSVTLTATADAGWRFSGWSGACTGTGTCTTSMTQARSVTATFVRVYGLSATQVGNGTVTSSPSGISLAAPGSAAVDFDTGTSVTLTATPATGWDFTGWSGACTGTGTCTTSMTQARSVTATFTIQQFALSATQVGSGSVSSNPAGISLAAAGSTSATFDYGTSVTLTATPAAGYAFSGWSGACTGTGACTTSLTQARSVTATFIAGHTLTATQVGSGTVTSSPAGISLAAAGSASAGYNGGTSVTLTATPATGWVFAGWSGDCTGTGACTTTLSQNRAVTATFTIQRYTLTATQVGSGTVTSSPAGISLAAEGSTTATFDYGTSVTLTATPAAGFAFSGWSGACTGTGTCTTSITEARSVTATFAAIPAPPTTQAPAPSGPAQGASPVARPIPVRATIGKPGGRITAVGTLTIKGKPVPACSGAMTARKAGSYTVQCAPTPALTAALATGAVRVNITLTVRRTGAKAVKIARTVTVRPG